MSTTGLRQTSTRSAPPASPGADIKLWQLNLLRVAYLEVGAGLALTRWPGFFSHQPWELKEGTVEGMLFALSLLALLGLRYPRKMLPILMFEIAWKLAWLSSVALPLWLDGDLSGTAAEQVGKILWVVPVIAATPWRYVITQYVTLPGDPWRRRR